jgi:5-methyltetrahydropteroyltriglutamate--homocysteine methyltransferase
MKSSRDHILTTHAGSLPRPDALIDLYRARESGEAVDERRIQERLHAAVVAVVRRQQEIGLDVPGDGEYGKSMGQRVNYRAWWSYSFQRLGGLELGRQGLYEMPPRRSRPGEVVLTSFADRRDRARFAAAYADPDSGVSTGPRASAWPVCVGPLTYRGHAAIAADIARFQAGLRAASLDEGFMTSIAPGSASRIANAYYKTDEEVLFACAEAMREEYRAIVEAGLILQLDDPAVAENWDMINPAPTVEEYRRFSMVRVEALNHAIRGLPEDRIRFHLCWGSWHGPHTTDIPLRDIVDVMLAVRCGAYSFEAGNVRHEHEWRVWQDVKLPAGKLILPGVVSHATNVVEHPELVAERIGRFADVVGKERVIASTDCGLGGRVHPEIAWAKLESLAEGAALASRQLGR